MAETVSAMDSSDEEDYYDVSDSFPDPRCEEGKNTPAAPQSDLKPLYVPIEPSPPVQITVDKVSREALSLHWDTPAGEVESYIVTCCSVQETTDTNKMTFNNLKPGECYFLGDTPRELTGGSGVGSPRRREAILSTVLSIDEKTITDEPAKCNSDLPWYFLKKLMMVNVTARNVKCTSACESNSGDHLDLDNLDKVHIQQEMALKMSMCQFSVPLLLPNCDTKQCTLMLWAMRDITSVTLESKGFIEERIVVSELPMISFVRLGECSLSKSEILNKLLSNSQQYHDTLFTPTWRVVTVQGEYPMDWLK
ncbi:hypothetical protein F7725_006227 [Dissostichus mawsoni]|uniref:Fibronectin type-III domain-containing protein n=1 Tax=Dissostichus mawsoni TaxID=36200 RepID=A0A7J5YTF3_DISMA|nr:hypothetical protein F7725_006227 [Dissostichus mawsoni]